MGYDEFVGPTLDQLGGGKLDKLAGALGGGSYAALGSLAGPIGTIIGGGLDVGTKIASLFQTSPEGKAKINATKAQENLEKAGMQIWERVQNGSLSPATAIKMIDTMIAQAGSYGQTNSAGGQGIANYDKLGMSTALSNLNQIRGNLTDQYNWSINNLSMDKSNEQYGMGAYLQDPTAQKDYMKTALRNKMMGFKAGDTALAGSPLEKALTPFDTYKNFDTAMGSVKNYVPDYQDSEGIKKLRAKLEGGFNG